MAEGKRAWFLSDLHLFARRSSAAGMHAGILEAVRQADAFVLGGDIFDFHWSTHASREESVRQSMDWLERLVAANTACRFHYLLGNHDSHPRFVEELQKLSERLPQLEWHRHLLRISHSVFLHGDIVDARVRPGEIHHAVLDARRLAKDDRRPPAGISHALYDLVVRTRVHRAVVHLSKRQKTVLRRVSRYLEAQGEGPSSGVRDVYFGHTHRRMNNVRFGGLNFHNPGATIRGLPFRMIEVALPESGGGEAGGRAAVELPPVEKDL